MVTFGVLRIPYTRGGGGFVGKEFSVDVEDLMKVLLMQQSQLGSGHQASMSNFLISFLTQMGRSGEGLNCITLFMVLDFTNIICMKT